MATFRTGFTFTWALEKWMDRSASLADVQAFSPMITANMGRMWGNPTVRGTRVPIFRIEELFKAGYTVEQIGTEIYPHLGTDLVIVALREVGYDLLDTSAANSILANVA